MREVAYIVYDELRRGLRPTYKTSRDSGFLVECINGQGSNSGVVPHDFFESPVSAAELLAKSITVEFPFPQMFLGMSVNLLVTETKVYTINANRTLTQITTYDATNTGVGKSIDANGGSWHFIDMGTSWMLFNGQQVVFKSNYHVIDTTFTSNALVSDILINTGCAFRGRVMLGGFDPTDSHPVHGAIPANAVLYSMVGGDDAFWSVLPQFCTETAKNDYLASEEGDYIVVPDTGTIQCVKPLHNAVIVYGESGVYALVPRDDLFEVIYLYNRGIAGRSAANGTLYNHVFVTKDGILCSIGSDLSVKPLGYEEYLWQMVPKSDLASDIVVSVDDSENTFYISNDLYCFVLNRNGLSRTTNLFTSMGRPSPTTDYVSTMYEGKLLAIYEESDVPIIRLTTDTMDMGTRALKRIGWIEVASADIARLSIAVEYKYDSTYYTGYYKYTSTPWITANKEGSAYIGVSGVDFRVKIVGNMNVLGSLDRIIVRYQVSDRRWIRGVIPSVTK